MNWRVPRGRFEKQKYAGNKRAMKALVTAGTVPGILAYHGEDPIGWCAVAPREDYPALARSRILKPVDDRHCWSISCFFVKPGQRMQGVATALVRGAVNFARRNGARCIEAYPVVPKSGRDIPAAFAWTGLPAAFVCNGFREVARRSPTRPIMRRLMRPSGEMK